METYYDGETTSGAGVAEVAAPSERSEKTVISRIPYGAAE